MNIIKSRWLWAINFFLLLSFSHVQALSAQEVYENVKDSIFTLYGLDFDTRSIKARGSAVAISKNVLATNCHVALVGNYLVVKVNDKPRVARLFFKDENEDLCLVEIPNANFNPVKIRNSDTVKIGEVVYAIGNPRGTEKTLSKGIISNIHKVKNGVWLQTDATVYYGSSGGGLFDENGKLIGIMTKMGGNFGFAIPTEWILKVINPQDNKEAMNDSSSLQAQQQPQPQTQAPTPSPKPDESQPTDYSPAYANLQPLGTYGSLALYRNNQECFLVFPGKTADGKVVSVALWNPRYAQSMVIFTNISDIKDALIEIYKSVIDKRTKSQEGFLSDYMLFFNGYSYRLQGVKTDARTYQFYVAKIEQDPLKALNEIKQFTANLGSTVTYSTDGFAAGLAAYKEKCGSRDSN